MSEAAEILERLARIEDAIAFRPAWIAGNCALGRYIGKVDRKGRVARAWAVKEQLFVKKINGVPHYSLKDVDAAMRNGRDVEVAV